MLISSVQIDDDVIDSEQLTDDEMGAVVLL